MLAPSGIATGVLLSSGVIMLGHLSRASPVVLIDTAGVAHDKCPNIMINTPLDNIFRQRVQEVVFAPRQFLTRPLCRL